MVGIHLLAYAGYTMVGIYLPVYASHYYTLGTPTILPSVRATRLPPCATRGAGRQGPGLYSEETPG